jgi:hypothetical protein
MQSRLVEMSVVHVLATPANDGDVLHLRYTNHIYVTLSSSFMGTAQVSLATLEHPEICRHAHC